MRLSQRRHPFPPSKMWNENLAQFALIRSHIGRVHPFPTGFLAAMLSIICRSSKYFASRSSGNCFSCSRVKTGTHGMPKSGLKWSAYLTVLAIRLFNMAVVRSSFCACHPTPFPTCVSSVVSRQKATRVQPRLEDDVAKEVLRRVATSGRKVQTEVNELLRKACGLKPLFK